MKYRVQFYAEATIGATAYRVIEADTSEAAYETACLMAHNGEISRLEFEFRDHDYHDIDENGITVEEVEEVDE